MEDVADGEVVGEGGPDQCEGCTGDSDKAGDTGTACGFAESFGRDGQLETYSEGAKGDRAAEERIDAECQGDVKREFAEKDGMGCSMGREFPRFYFRRVRREMPVCCAIGGLAAV